MIDLEIYLERHHSNNDGSPEVEKIPLTEVIGKGEYVIKNGSRLHIRDYETTNASNGLTRSVKQVTLNFGEDPKKMIELDTTGIGRLHIPPNQWLVVQDNTVLERQILPD